ncbi:transient receptor potential cation subfamily member 4 [Stylonychia lemnae]|uniref:Transient receptor potential cation subfamily member 4 n=1 Tax=Stylonychia lemnae TaxID=5949 RepID=A0A078ATI2_STYLE|nr:transient receptor potential cation subfamily member 4 [Stylonychia lemnae]|eukprot:CDW85311.1 transient receptor potential cation subfamily member 4 [Stylonychia lemnae]
MQVRYFIEAAFFIALSCFFQYYISAFNSLIHKIHEEIQLITHQEGNHEEYLKELDSLLLEAGEDIYTAMYVSILIASINEQRSRLQNDFGEGHLTTHEIFILNVIEDISDGSFRFDILLAIHTGFLWLKVMLLLKLTRMFGPLIKIVESMLVDIGQFAVVWIINLVFFACVGMLLFGEIEVYDHFQDTIIMFIESALGDWNLHIYDDLKIGPYFGKIYHLVFLIFNMVLMLNLMIAILSTTFSILQEKKLALYYDGVIEAIPQYKYDKTYGSMICAFPPMNLIIFPFNIFGKMIKDKIILRKLDDFLMKIAYLPVLILSLTLFVIGNLIALPFAYLFTVSLKFKHAFQTNNALHFLIFGLIYLTFSQITDIFIFFRHSFSNNYEKLQPFNRPVISRDGKTHVRMKDIMTRLREMTNINENIQLIVYGPLMKSKINDSEYEHIVRKDNFLKNIQGFNSLKLVVGNCCNEQNMVDVKLVNIHVKEMEIKMRIIVSNLKKEANLIIKNQTIFRQNLKIGQIKDKLQVSKYLITEYQRQKKNISTEFAFVNPKRIIESIQPQQDRDNKENSQVLKSILNMVQDIKDQHLAQRKRSKVRIAVTNLMPLNKTATDNFPIRSEDQGALTTHEQRRHKTTKLEDNFDGDSFWDDLENIEENKLNDSVDF